MEGFRRGRACRAAVLVCMASVVGASGCASDASELDGIRARDPAAAFAPLVRLDRAERWRPAGAKWFIARSALWFAQRARCKDQKVAVGRALEAQRKSPVGFIGLAAIGRRGFYHRDVWEPGCSGSVVDLHADQVTRPFQRRGRAAGAAIQAGFYLDLMDWARAGRRLRASGGRRSVSGVPAYVAQRSAEVKGEPGLVVTYWLLYGMHRPPVARDGVRPPTREGDWERVEVALQRGDDRDEYLPVSVQATDGWVRRRWPWAAFERVSGGTGGRATHPVISAARGDHALSPGPPTACPACIGWRTWERLADVREQPWYGFGGAWGEPGSSSATTGPLGPR